LKRVCANCVMEEVLPARLSSIAGARKNAQ
jgi:hypothetical protein